MSSSALQLGDNVGWSPAGTCRGSIGDNPVAMPFVRYAILVTLLPPDRRL